ncbi:MAG: hypothetical protein ACRDKI_08320 [Solirubrobacterales bacterium]
MSFAASLAVVAIAPAVAQASFGGSLSESASTLQAAGHPNLTYTITPSGTEKLRDVNLAMGAGQHFNWEAPTSKCSSSSFSSDSCANATQVGTTSASITYGGATTVPGTIYQLSPSASDTATVGIVLRPPWYLFRPKIYLTANITTSSSTSALSASITNIPNNSGGTITVNSLALTFQARANSSNSGAYFALNPSRCAAATTTATLTGYSNSTAAPTASITPTGCGSVPFSGTVGATPSTTVKSAASGMNVTASFPTSDATIQNSTVKQQTFDLPQGSGLNFPALGVLQNNVCPQADLLQDVCPTTAPGSDMGDVTSSLPFLPPTASGDLYVTSLGNDMRFGVVVRAARGTTVIVPGGYGSVVDTDGDGSSDTIRTSLQNVPEDTVSTSTVNFTSTLFNNPSTCQSNTIHNTTDGWSGSSFNADSYYTTTGC